MTDYELFMLRRRRNHWRMLTGMFLAATAALVASVALEGFW